MQTPVCISQLNNAHCTWTLTPFPPKAPRQANRSDAGGAHAPKNDRSLLTQDAELPPGVSLQNGHPKDASPFFQAFLPTGFVHEGKKSKSVSYMGETVFAKGTTRTMEQAKACVLSWCWQWWNSLSTSDHSAIRETERVSGEPSSPESGGVLEMKRERRRKKLPECALVCRMPGLSQPQKRKQ